MGNDNSRIRVNDRVSLAKNLPAVDRLTKKV